MAQPASSAGASVRPASASPRPVAAPVWPFAASTRGGLACIGLGLALIVTALCPTAVAAADAVAFEVSATPSRDGVYQLTWTAPGPVVLEASADADFTRPEVIYRGHDTASTLSGRPDGATWYRLLDADTSAVLGQPVRVEVRHHPLSRALTFFGIGLFVFVATVVLIVRGARATAAAEGSEATRV